MPGNKQYKIGMDKYKVLLSGNCRQQISDDNSAKTVQIKIICPE